MPCQVLSTSTVLEKKTGNDETHGIVFCWEGARTGRLFHMELISILKTEPLPPKPRTAIRTLGILAGVPDAPIRRS